MEEIKPIKIEWANTQNFKYEEPKEKSNIVYPKWDVIFKDENTIIMKTNPKEWLKAKIKEMNNIDKDFDIPWIKVDSNVEPEYKIIRKSSHDGTLMFTGDIIAKALESLFYRSEEELLEHVNLIKLCTKNRYRGEITVFKWVKQNYKI